MTKVKRLGALSAVLGLAIVGLIATPGKAHAWWRVGVGIAVPPVVVGPPVYYAPPPVYYAPPPGYYPAPPPARWVPPHWENGYWVPGHYV